MSVTGEAARRPLSLWMAVRVGALDRLAAVVLAILTLPVVAVLGLIVRLADGRPSFIQVERMGRDFQPFGMWKVRSMRVDRADGSADGTSLTTAHDGRVTPVGVHLRRFHVDELPQLWNVVRGEMLLLGPRPESPTYVAPEAPEWREVLRVPPGIAGPTQMIVGDWERVIISEDPTGHRYQDEVVPAKLAIDRWYLESASLGLDVLVLVALTKRFLPGSKASRMKRRARLELPEVVEPILAAELASKPANRRRQVRGTGTEGMAS